jgi:Uncharacterized Rossmann fold enzyme
MAEKLKNMIDLEEWLKIYEKISKELNLSFQEDTRATELLSVLIRNKGLEAKVLESIVYKKHVIIAGAGPSIVDDLENVKKIDRKKVIYVTCDGATKAFQEIMDDIPDLIVTDLDGFPKEQVACSKEGSIVIVHAHGDNKEQIATYVPKLDKVIGTTQVRPKEKVYNFGGFTDGDRAAYIIGSFNPASITLIGMNLSEEVGTYSKPIIFDRTRKIIKLRIAKELLELFAKKIQEQKRNIKLFNLTKDANDDIKGFQPITLKKYVELVYK